MTLGRRPWRLLTLLGLMSPALFAQPDYTITLQDTTTVYRGYDLYVRLYVAITGPSGPLYFHTITASDSTITALPWCDYTHQSCWGSQPAYQYLTPNRPAVVFYLHILTQDSTPVGSHTITIRTSMPANRGLSPLSPPASADHFTTLTVNVSPLPPPPPPPTVQLQRLPQRLPSLTVWRERLKALGNKWCNLDATYTSGNESQVWYYDGAATYLRAADVFPANAQHWLQCAHSVVHQYRDFITINHLGRTWRYFPSGLAMAYQHDLGPMFGEPNSNSYKQAVLWLATSGTESQVKEEMMSDTWTREGAYTLNTFVQAHILGQPWNTQTARLVTMLLSQAQRKWVENQWWTTLQPFYEGLWMQSLIAYYEHTESLGYHLTERGCRPGPDPRIPPLVKATLDGIWTVAWDKSAFQLAYNLGTNVITRACNSDDFNCCSTTADGACWTGSSFHYTKDLTGLVVPGYAWYWHLTSDDLYRERADSLFHHMFDVPFDDKGKSFSQAYYWTFDYVRWRGGRATASQ